MGSSVNKVFLIGNLGQDPELRTTGSGKAVCNFSVATKDGRGDSERTEWHRIVAWERTAETCARHLTKGRQVFIEGRIQTRSWEDRDGGKRQTTEIVAYSVEFLDGGRGRQGAQQGQGAPPQQQGGYGRGYGGGGPQGGGYAPPGGYGGGQGGGYGQQGGGEPGF